MVQQDFMNPPPGPKCVDTVHGMAANGAATPCIIDSGFSFWVISAPPTPDQVTGICHSSNCMKLVSSMRQVAPTECVMYDGYYLYQDILNPILAQCTSVITAAPVVTAPTPTGEAPLNVTFPPEPTETPEATETPTPTSSDSTSIWATPSPTTRAPSGSISSNNGNDSSDSPMSPGTLFGIGIGVLIGVAIIGAIVRCTRQQNKRDQKVPLNQQLSYADVGGFDTVAPSAPVYTTHSETDTETYRPSAKQQRPKPSAPFNLTTTGLNFGTSSSRSNAIDLAQIPLLTDDQITAARVPMDKIKVGALLNAGGFGEVYKGSYKGQLVAIKKMLPQHRNDLRLVNSFLQEVKLMAAMDHERIVQFVGVAWGTAAPADLCVLSEFMAGGDLQTVLARFHLEKKPVGFDATKLKIALHVAHALTYMHSLQPVVLHRDLKSNNILMTTSLDAKLTDFGISRERVDATMTRGVGTSLWMAPEVMMGGRYDDKADVFSFGIVLSELDSNQLPYASQLDLASPSLRIMDELQNVAQGRLAVEFSYASHPDIVALGRACVMVDPQERPTAAEALYKIHQVLREV